MKIKNPVSQNTQKKKKNFLTSIKTGFTIQTCPAAEKYVHLATLYALLS